MDIDECFDPPDNLTDPSENFKDVRQHKFLPKNKCLADLTDQHLLNIFCKEWEGEYSQEFRAGGAKI